VNNTKSKKGTNKDMGNRDGETIKSKHHMIAI
jgi:hypothetical protein